MCQSQLRPTNRQINNIIKAYNDHNNNAGGLINFPVPVQNTHVTATEIS